MTTPSAFGSFEADANFDKLERRVLTNRANPAQRKLYFEALKLRPKPANDKVDELDQNKRGVTEPTITDRIKHVSTEVEEDPSFFDSIYNDIKKNYGSFGGGTIGSIISGMKKLPFFRTLGMVGALGGLGDLLQQGEQKITGDPRAPQTATESLGRAGIAAAEQSGGEAIFRPFLGAGRFIKDRILGPTKRSLSEGDLVAKEVFDRHGVPFTPFDINRNTFIGILETYMKNGMLSAGIIKRYTTTRIAAIEALENGLLDRTGKRQSYEGLGNIIFESASLHTKSVQEGMTKLIDRQVKRLTQQINKGYNKKAEESIKNLNVLQEMMEGEIKQSSAVKRVLKEVGSETDGNKLYQKFFKANNLKEVQALREIIPESDWKLFQRQFISDITEGGLEGIDSTLKKYTKEMVEAVLGEDQIILLKELNLMAKRSKLNSLKGYATNKQQLGILNILQGGLVIQASGAGLGFLTGAATGHDPYKAALIGTGAATLAPPMLAKLMSTKFGREWLTTGFGLAKNSPKADKWLRMGNDIMTGTIGRYLTTGSGPEVSSQGAQTGGQGNPLASVGINPTTTPPASSTATP